jgi:hypothetical protein
MKAPEPKPLSGELREEIENLSLEQLREAARLIRQRMQQLRRLNQAKKSRGKTYLDKTIKDLGLPVRVMP